MRVRTIDDARAIARAITYAAIDGIPEGYAYAALMGDVSLELFRAIVDQLVRGDVIERRGGMLYITQSTRRLMAEDERRQKP